MRYFSQFLAVLAVVVLAGYQPQSVQAQTNVFPSYFEDFESGSNGWSASGTRSSWQLGYPSSGDIYYPGSGSNSWVTNLYGSYNSNEYSYLESPVFDMSCFASDPYLGFSHTYFTEDNYDFHWVEISINGGSWQKLGNAGEGSGWYQSWKDASTGEILDVWCGYYQYNYGWEYAEHQLTGAAGSSNVRIRFVMKADDSYELDGVGIDDIQIYLPGAELGTPSLTTPTNNATNVSLTPSLTWQSVGCAQTYSLQVSTNPSFSAVVIDQSVVGTSVDLGILNFLTTYYWRVRANNSSMSSQWSAVYNFTTAPPPPPIPTLSTPTDGSKSFPTVNATLVWNNSLGASSYQVQCSKSSSFSTTIVDNTSGANFVTLPNLENYTQYYWRVNASNSSGTSAWSAAWSFRTVLSSTTLISPADKETYITNPATVVWAAVNGADYYWIQISDDESFSTIIDENTHSVLPTYQAKSLANNTTYYWRVKVITPDGETSNWSETRSFTTIIATPQPISPVDGKLDVPTVIAFEWKSVQGEVQYNLQVSTDFSFTKSIIVDKTYPTLYQTLNGFANNTVYYWRVRAVSSTSGNSGWSDIRSFSTVVSPTIGELPADKARGQQIPVTLQWASSGEKIVYQVQFATDESFKTIIIDQSRIGNVFSQFSEYEGLKYNTTYYWRVRPESSTGISIDWSPTRSFTTVIAKPSLVSPVNNSGNQLPNTQLIWKPVEGAVTYHVQFSTDKTFTTTIVDQETITLTQYSVSNLAINTIYYWRVQSTSSDNGTSSWSDVWKFSTGLAPAGTPSLQFPTNNTAQQPAKFDFQWNPSDNAVTYHLQVSKTANFVTPVIDEYGISSSSFPATGLEYNTTYYWRVSAINETGEGDWSDVWKFTVGPAIPAAPLLVLPADRVENQSTSLRLQWDKPTQGGQVDNYRVQVSESGDFSSTIIDESGVSTNSFSISSLNNNTVYYWRVSALNAGGSGAWSETWSFKTEILNGVEANDTEIGVTLESVIPNPVQSSAFVSFTTTSPVQSAMLRIYSVTGLEVFSIVENDLQSGRHSYNWNTSQIPTGVYVIKLNVGNSIRSTFINVVK